MPKTTRYIYLTLYILITLILSANLTFSQNSLASSTVPLTLLQPVLAANTQMASKMAQTETEPFIKQKGHVSLVAVNVFRNKLIQSNDLSEGTSFIGQPLVISFFSGQEITVIVDYESHSENNVISLGGHQIDSDMSTFTMTMAEGHYLIRYQDLNNAIAYKVVGNTETGLGIVTEIDLTKIPPIYDADPVTFPKE